MQHPVVQVTLARKEHLFIGVRDRFAVNVSCHFSRFTSTNFVFEEYCVLLRLRTGQNCDDNLNNLLHTHKDNQASVSQDTNKLIILLSQLARTFWCILAASQQETGDNITSNVSRNRRLLSISDIRDALFNRRAEHSTLWCFCGDVYMEAMHCNKSKTHVLLVCKILFFCW